MATIREYFDADMSKSLTMHDGWVLNDQEKNLSHEIIARISFDFNANAKYWSFYVPSGPDLIGYVLAIYNTPHVETCTLYPEGNPVMIQTGYQNSPNEANSESLVFTNRLILYLDFLVTEQVRNRIIKLGEDSGYSVLIRDQEYAKIRSSMEKPLAFISHDSRDKEELVRPLAFELSKLMCPIWYDEFSLRVGMSLRESIENGLKETKKCVLIVSPHFISNKGWGKTEYDSVFTKEIIKEENVILPVWHNVTKEQVYDFSPKLADKFALSSDLGIKDLARKLSREIKRKGE